MKGEVKIIFGKTLIRKKLSPHLCLSRRTLLGGKYLFSEVVCDHEDAAGLEIWPKLGAEVIASPRCSGLSDCGNLKARIGSIIAWHWETWEGTWQLGWDANAFLLLLPLGGEDVGRVTGVFPPCIAVRFGP